MPTYDLLITRGKLVIPKQGIIDADLAVKDGKVAPILNKDSQADADFAIVDMNLVKTVTPQLLQHSSDYNIYEGMDLKGWPVYTLVRGTVVQKDGQITAPKGTGEYMKLTDWLK